MKTLTFLLSLCVIISFSSCEDKIVENEMPEGEIGFYITGVSQSLNYVFNSGSRLSETPDEIRELNILILDQSGDIVYEQWYFNHNYYYHQDSTMTNGDTFFYENTIPDTLFIPALPQGNYDILASTTYLNYYSDPIYNPDGTISQGPITYPKIEPYNVSENPIYVGKATIALNEESQEVVLNMRNISARITLSREEDTTNIEGGHLELIFNTKNNKYFSFAEDALLDYEYDYYIYTYMLDEKKKHFYVLPKILSSVAAAYFHDHVEMYNFRIEMPIEPNIDLQINDAISFSINLGDLLDGASSGTVLWDQITWNDLGEISIP
jgi:hypothetical protein